MKSPAFTTPLTIVGTCPMKATFSYFHNSLSSGIFPRTPGFVETTKSCEDPSVFKEILPELDPTICAG